MLKLFLQRSITSHLTPVQYYSTKVSQLFIPTHYRDPKDATIQSHILLIRAGFIRKHCSGIYTLLPLATRVIEKITKIIDEEMQRIHCQKLMMPHLLSSELWERTGRWKASGKELIRIKDRHGSDFCLAPTHEEVITFLMSQEAVSYKSLPQRLYQIGTKYRDEFLPRYGLLRAREFIMKDLYTFDATKQGALETYQQVYESYKRIFDRMELNYVIVEADSGNIGGNLSHEFQVVSDVGEDVVLYCDCEGRYAANIEKAVGEVPAGEQEKRETYLQASFENGEKKIYRLVLGKDRKVNLIATQKCLGASELEEVQATPEVMEQALKNGVLVDSSVAGKESHSDGIITGDFRLAQQGDICSKADEIKVCQKRKLKEARGIEVGHVFYLGDKYSKALECNVLGEDHKLRPIEMGCYGIGVTRVMQAIVQTSHDKDGIIWPTSVAPYQICVIPLMAKKMDAKDHKIVNTAEEICRDLEKMPQFRGEVVLDDRFERPPVKLKDASLIGYPYIVVLGEKFVNEGLIELQIRNREGTTKNYKTLQGLLDWFKQK